MENEVWKDIEGYEGSYKISSFGNVKSLSRITKYKNSVRKSKEIILKYALDKGGYRYVVLRSEGISKVKKIHQLVAIAFLNHKPCGFNLVVNHKDFNRANNYASNLELVTMRENGNLKHIKSSSEYTGVTWRKNRNKWQAMIMIDKKYKYLGCFENEIDAHNAYQKALKEL